MLCFVHLFVESSFQKDRLVAGQDDVPLSGTELEINVGVVSTRRNGSTR